MKNTDITMTVNAASEAPRDWNEHDRDFTPGTVDYIEPQPAPELATASLRQGEPTTADLRHSPLPWVENGIEAHSIRSRESGLRILTLNSDSDRISDDERKANAALIVRAVNNIDALADVLREFVRVMEDPRTTAAMPHTVKKARFALRNLEGSR